MVIFKITAEKYLKLLLKVLQRIVQNFNVVGLSVLEIKIGK